MQLRYEQFAQGVRQSLVSVAAHLEHDETRHFLDDDVKRSPGSDYPVEVTYLDERRFSFTTQTGI